MTSNQIAYANYLESKRHNVEAENLTRQANTEIAYHNRRSEELGFYDATTSRMNARTNATNASTNAFNAQINYYKAQTEAAKLTETKRHNEISEYISAGGFSTSILGQSLSGNLAIYPLAFGASEITDNPKDEGPRGAGRRYIPNRNSAKSRNSRHHR